MMEQVVIPQAFRSCLAKSDGSEFDWDDGLVWRVSVGFVTFR